MELEDIMLSESEEVGQMPDDLRFCGIQETR